MKQYNIIFPIYAESDEEAKALERDLKEFMQLKYNQDIFVRASRLSNLIRQFGNSMIVNNALR